MRIQWISHKIIPNFGILQTLQLALLLLSAHQANAQLGSGIYTVGMSGTEDFSSLTNTGGLFHYINTNGITGTAQINITTDLSAETGSYSLDAWVGTGTLSITPADASLKSITKIGSCTSALLNFSDADQVTIDGSFNGTGKYLQFISTCSNEPVIKFNGDCLNITLKNIIVSSDNSSNTSSSGGAVLINSNQPVTGVDNFTLSNCLIEDFSGNADLFYGLLFNSSWTSGVISENLQITANEFNAINGKSILLRSNGGLVNGAQITRNSFYSTKSIGGPGAGVFYSAIEIESGSGHTLFGNKIGGQAPNCGGSKMLIDCSGGSNRISGIKISINVPNSSTNQIDSNVVRNIHINGSSTSYTSVYLIVVERGNCAVGSTYGNYLGNNTISMSTITDASISMTENYNSSLNSLQGIHTSSSGDVTIHNNKLGGIYLSANSTSGIYSHLIGSSSVRANITNNQIGGVPANIIQQGNNAISGIYQISLPAGTSSSVQNNTITGIKTESSFSNDAYGYRSSGSGHCNLESNTISLFDITGSFARFIAIRIDNNSSYLSANHVHHNFLNSNSSGLQYYGVYTLLSNGATTTIVGNIIEKGGITATSNVQRSIVGIYTNIANATFNLSRNKIDSLVNSSGNNTSSIRGIWSSAGTVSITNNVVLLDNSSNTNDLELYGVYDMMTSGNISLYHNTIDLKGSQTGNRRSACYGQTGSATRNVQSNIFSNSRTGGTGGHYAIYYGTTGSTLTCNYNLLYTQENESKLIWYGTNLNFASWQTLGFDLSSVNPSATQTLVDFSTGKPMTTHGTDIAANVGVSIDYESTSRPIGTGYDMGAFEMDESLLGSGLPVELIHFSSECIEGAVKIFWTTKSELQNDYFVVEKSFDGMSFWPIEIIDGHLNSSQEIHYSCLDQDISERICYYRIIQVDMDGSKKYYPPIQQDVCLDETCVQVQTENSTDQIRIHLDPTKFCFGEYANIQLHDIHSRVVYQNVLVLSENSELLIENNLPAGLYILTIYSDFKSESYKIYIH